MDPRIVFVMLAVVGAGVQVEAIKCYVCNSFNEISCASSPLTDLLLVDCPEDKNTTHPACRKTIQIMESETGDPRIDRRVIRECAKGIEDKYFGKCFHRSGFGSVQEVCSCEEDKCNNSYRTSAVSIFALLTVTSMVLLN